MVQKKKGLRCQYEKEKRTIDFNRSAGHPSDVRLKNDFHTRVTAPAQAAIANK